LSSELNYNIMLSQRGVLLPLYNRHDIDSARRAVNAMQLNGIDAELLDREETLRFEPLLNKDPDARFAPRGGILQRRGGTARHDAVAWGYARGASSLGVDIIQNCAVTGFAIEGGKVRGVKTTLGDIGCDRVGVAVAGNSTEIARMAGFPLPIRSVTLQAAVTEPLKPVLNSVVMAVHGPGIYASQSDKGEIVFGGGIDPYNSFAQRGNVNTLEGIVAGLLETFPFLSRVKLMRQWAGTVDVVPDSSPIIDETPVRDLFVNCGWGTGGFKAIPAGGWLFAHLLGTGKHHAMSEPFGFDRFRSLELIDETGAAGISH
jgi:sarcosine oxidase subunit beta